MGAQLQCKAQRNLGRPKAAAQCLASHRQSRTKYSPLKRRSSKSSRSGSCTSPESAALSKPIVVLVRDDLTFLRKFRKPVYVDLTQDEHFPRTYTAYCSTGLGRPLQLQEVEKQTPRVLYKLYTMSHAPLSRQLPSSTTNPSILEDRDHGFIHVARTFAGRYTTYIALADLHLRNGK